MGGPEFRGKVEGATKRALVVRIRKQHSFRTSDEFCIISVHMPTSHTGRLSPCLALLKKDLTSMMMFEEVPFIMGGDFNHNVASL